MKTIVQYFCVLMLLALASTPAIAQKSDPKAEKEVVTVEFEVAGVCEMCKSRIENAALIKGVKYVSWEPSTGITKVVYKSWKVTEEEIHKAIASVGHDTEKVKATDEEYDHLNGGCCDYRNGVTNH